MNNSTKDEKSQKAIFHDPETQETLNTPLPNPEGVSDKNREFLKMVMNLINEGKIDLLKPDTLINHAVYDNLPEPERGKADLEAVNLLFAIKEIKYLFESGFSETYQMQNLLERVRNTKERLEDSTGDLFII
ncbi:MAG: hypothetical protein ABIH78_00190 [Candidatus Peregrinibacteria bacterium]